MKIVKKVLSMALVIALLISTNALAFAAENQNTPSEKEEVVYINLDGQGKVSDIYVVNSFAAGEILDYGDYTSVKMLNTDDSIRQNGDEITFTSSAEKVYYQGELSNAQIPWDISLQYFLDGKEYTASEIAGRSGKLEIRFCVAKNPACVGDFFDQYALQASFTLDTDQCRNIVAPDATVANVGSKKQLTYTVLPGEGLETTISADATDFEMSGVSINGILLNLNVDVEDEALKDKVGQLIDATVELDHGAESMDGGAAQIKGGSGELKDGSYSLHSGISSLDGGMETLQTGLSTVQEGLDSLNQQSSTLVNGSSQVKTALEQIQSAVNSISITSQDISQLVQASGQIKQSIGDLYDGAQELQENLGYDQYKKLMAQNGLDIDQLKQGNGQAISSLDGLTTSLEDVIKQLESMPGTESQVEQLKTQIKQLESVETLLEGNNQAIGGMESYLNGLDEKMPELTDSLAELEENYEQFDASITTLVDTLKGMLGNLSLLSSGVNQLVDQYETLDAGIDDYTDGVGQIVAGYSQVMGGVSALAQGSKELVSGSDDLYTGTTQLYDAVSELCDGAQEMADGTGALHQQTSGMESKIEQEIDQLLGSIGGDMQNPVSFVSPKNTQVDLVQFVIQTDPVERQEEPDLDAQEPAQTSFWQKLLELFGIEA